MRIGATRSGKTLGYDRLFQEYEIHVVRRSRDVQVFFTEPPVGSGGAGEVVGSFTATAEVAETLAKALLAASSEEAAIPVEMKLQITEIWDP